MAACALRVAKPIGYASGAVLVGFPYIQHTFNIHSTYIQHPFNTHSTQAIFVGKLYVFLTKAEKLSAVTTIIYLK